MLGFGKQKEPERKKSRNKKGSKNKSKGSNSNENRELAKLRKKLDQAYEEIDTMAEELDLIQEEVDTFFEETPDESLSMLDQISNIKFMVTELQQENAELKSENVPLSSVVRDSGIISTFSEAEVPLKDESSDRVDNYSLDSRLRKYDLKLNDHDERLDGLEIDVRSLKQQVALLTPISSGVHTLSATEDTFETETASNQYNNDLASIQGKIDRIKQETDRLIDRYDPEEDIIDIQVIDEETEDDAVISSDNTSSAYMNAFNAMDDLLFQ